MKIVKSENRNTLGGKKHSIIPPWRSWRSWLSEKLGEQKHSITFHLLVHHCPHSMAINRRRGPRRSSELRAPYIHRHALVRSVNSTEASFSSPKLRFVSWCGKNIMYHILYHILYHIISTNFHVFISSTWISRGFSPKKKTPVSTGSTAARPSLMNRGVPWSQRRPRPPVRPPRRRIWKLP